MDDLVKNNNAIQLNRKNETDTNTKGNKYLKPRSRPQFCQILKLLLRNGIKLQLRKYIQTFSRFSQFCVQILRRSFVCPDSRDPQRHFRDNRDGSFW